MRSFGVAATGVTLCLVAASGVLTVSALERGPRLRDVVGDPALTVQQDGVTLGLRADQPLAEASRAGVRVEPAVPVETEIVGSTLRVRFLATLEFGVDYRVTVPHLTGRSTAATAATEFGFRTPALTVTTLERGGVYDRNAGEDRIVRRDVLTGAQTVLFAAPRIQEYAVDGDSLLVHVLEDTGVATLTRVDADGAPVPLARPGDGLIGLLRASDDAQRAGYVYTGSGAAGESYANILFTVDLTDPNAPARVVPGVDGAPLQVDSWYFIPGSTYLVAQSPDATLTLVDATGAAPARRLGEVGQLRAVLPGATSIVVDGAAGTAVLDLTDGSLTDIGAMDVDRVWSGSVIVSETSSLRWTSAVVQRADGESDQTVFTAAPEHRIEEVCLSPSGRHAIVGTVTDGAVIDGYPARADWVGRDSTVVDLGTGASVATIPGTRPSWCE